MPSGNKPLPEMIMTIFYDVVYRMALLDHFGLTVEMD